MQKDLGLYDQLKLDWISRFSQLTLEENASKKVTSNQMTGQPTMTKGWALHKVRTNKRFSKDVKDYLLAKYNLGEKTGSKCDPQNVAEEMRKTRLPDGKKIFSREDWLTKSQIKSFFSRVTATRRKRQGSLQELDSIDQEDDDLDTEELAEMEENDERNDLKDIILSDIALQHPIIYDTFNLCEIFKQKELKTFNVKMLKQISNELEIRIKSRDVKMTIIEKLSSELANVPATNK